MSLQVLGVSYLAVVVRIGRRGKRGEQKFQQCPNHRFRGGMWLYKQSFCSMKHNRAKHSLKNSYCVCGKTDDTDSSTWRTSRHPVGNKVGHEVCTGMQSESRREVGLRVILY